MTSSDVLVMIFLNVKLFSIGPVLERENTSKAANQVALHSSSSTQCSVISAELKTTNLLYTETSLWSKETMTAV